MSRIRIYLHRRQGRTNPDYCPGLPATGEFCRAHLERAGVEIRATLIIGGEPMCSACFKGLPVDPKENLDRLNTVPNVPFVKPKGEPPQTPEEEEHSLVQSSLSPGRLLTARRF